MVSKTIIDELRDLGTEQNRKIYRRHGVGDDMFGVSFANIRKLQKRIKKDHALALELWSSGNHDARILATMIADPKIGDEGQLEDWLESWVGDLDNYVVTDAFAELVSKTALAREKAENWTKSDEEWTGRAGWIVMAKIAMKDKILPDEYFEDLLPTIEAEIHIAQNRVRDAMNSALIAIGIRNEKLQELALVAARNIGKVEVAHGATGCVTPDAGGYILKTVSRRALKS